MIESKAILPPCGYPPAKPSSLVDQQNPFAVIFGQSSRSKSGNAAAKNKKVKQGRIGCGFSWRRCWILR
jgi:hypothetical protein